MLGVAKQTDFVFFILSLFDFNSNIAGSACIKFVFFLIFFLGINIGMLGGCVPLTLARWRWSLRPRLGRIAGRKEEKVGQKKLVQKQFWKQYREDKKSILYQTKEKFNIIKDIK